MSSVSGRVKVEYQNISIKSEHGYVPVKEEDTDDEVVLDLGKKEEDVNVASWASNLKKRKVFDMLEYAKPPVDKGKLPHASPTTVVSKETPSNPPHSEKCTPTGGATKKVRKMCSFDGCTNIVTNNGVCHRHRAKKKPCSHEGCTNISQRRGLCDRHRGRKKKTCSHDGCTNISIKGGVCVKHGSKLKTCSHEGCVNATKGGVCRSHGAMRKLCSQDECTNQARAGGVCTRHGAQRKSCSHSGCTNQAVKEGVCIKHGAKVSLKICSHAGCTNQVVKEEFV